MNVGELRKILDSYSDNLIVGIIEKDNVVIHDIERNQITSNLVSNSVGELDLVLCIGFPVTAITGNGG